MNTDEMKSALGECESAAAALLAKLKEEREKLDTDKSTFEVRKSCGIGWYIATSPVFPYHILAQDKNVYPSLTAAHPIEVYWNSEEAAERFLAAWRGEKYISKKEKEQQYKDSFAIQASGTPGYYFIGTTNCSSCFLWPDGMVHNTLVADDWAAYWTSQRAAEAFLLKWQGKPVTPKHGDVVLNLEGERRLIVCAGGSLIAVAENGVVWASPGHCWSVEGRYESTERPYTVVGNIFEGDKWTGS